VRGEYVPILAAYREGNNAVNSLFRALSYYKVTEAIRRLRKQRREEQRQAGHRAHAPANERFPADETQIRIHPALQPAFRPYLSRRFADVLENDLRVRVRNAYAHLNPLEPFLTTDLFDDMTAADSIAPVLKTIARTMLGNDLSELSGVPARREHPG